MNLENSVRFTVPPPVLQTEVFFVGGWKQKRLGLTIRTTTLLHTSLKLNHTLRSLAMIRPKAKPSRWILSSPTIYLKESYPFSLLQASSELARSAKDGTRSYLLEDSYGTSPTTTTATATTTTLFLRDLGTSCSPAPMIRPVMLTTRLSRNGTPLISPASRLRIGLLLPLVDWFVSWTTTVETRSTSPTLSPSNGGGSSNRRVTGLQTTRHCQLQ